jgi:hypothetical protein
MAPKDRHPADQEFSARASRGQQRAVTVPAEPPQPDAPEPTGPVTVPVEPQRPAAPQPQGPQEPLGPVEVPEPGVVDVPEPGIVEVPERRV